MSNAMKWISYDGDPQKLRDLPYGTILLVEDEFDNYNMIKVLGDGVIVSNQCDQTDREGWMFYEADWSSLDCGYKVLKYAIPPDEYQQFLDSSVDELNKSN